MLPEVLSCDNAVLTVDSNTCVEKGCDQASSGAGGRGKEKHQHRCTFHWIVASTLVSLKPLIHLQPKPCDA